MRIIDFRPEITPFKDGQILYAGAWHSSIRMRAWRACDEQQPAGHRIRSIWHYRTFMGFYEGVPYCEFCANESIEYKIECFNSHEDDGGWAHEWKWVFYPESIGHGGASDQGGMNDLMGLRGKWQNGYQHYESYGYSYHRDLRGGGPRIVEDATGEVVCD